MEETYLCHQCKTIFKLPLTCSITAVKQEIKCPNCGNIDVEALPTWAPIGLTEFSSVWEYECQECKHKFELPIPSSPSQEQEIKCPVCKGELTLTVYRGGIEKYLSAAHQLVRKYGLLEYYAQRLSIVEDEIRTLFDGKKPKQISLTAFVA